MRAVWKDTEALRELRAAAAELLVESGEIGPLVAVLEDETELDWIRAEAARRLAETKDDAVREPLRTAAKDKTPFVRNAAVRALSATRRGVRRQTPSDAHGRLGPRPGRPVRHGAGSEPLGVAPSLGALRRRRNSASRPARWSFWP